MNAPFARTRILIVDDSATVRKLLGDALRREPDLEVVGAAPDPFVARDMILALQPDIITLDLEMPRMDGLTFLGKLMEHHPLPVIVISSLTHAGSEASIEALRLGAIEVIPKPGGPYSVGQITDTLKRCIRNARRAKFHLQPPPAAPAAAPPPGDAPLPAHASARGLIVIGASTGGPQALEGLLSRMPAMSPPMLVVQHMPPGFTRSLAERLDRETALTVREAAGGETPRPGTVYVAPGGRHLVLEQAGSHFVTRLHDGPLAHYQRPAVDVLFDSVARLHGLFRVGVLLTGMGADGANGMVALRDSGAVTIAEAEESCVVFGMPKEAIARGGASAVAPLLQIPASIVRSIRELSRAAA